MCGIAGFYGHNVFLDKSVQKDIIQNLSHRGPDSNGIFTNKDKNVFLAHTRLSILDISDKGSQPMKSHCKNFVISFNGEIYNHLELRDILRTKFKFDRWNGNSDTETLVNLFTYFNIQEVLNLLKGMFAFALWNLKEETFIIARDIAGEKPLYWSKSGENIFFSSEISTMALMIEGSEEKVSFAGLDFLCRNSYIPTPLTIIENVNKLPSGKFLEASITEGKIKYKINTFWNANKIRLEKYKNPLNISDTKAINKLEVLLMDSIESQLISDVPLGAFLSGGVDSSLIVSLMSEIRPHSTKTFTIGFEDKTYDESTSAKEIASYLGTEHIEQVLTEDELLEIIPSIPLYYSEPLGDSSQIPTILLSKLARKHVTVALTGDCGDELFGGYKTYKLAIQSWKVVNSLPTILKKMLRKVLTVLKVQGKYKKFTNLLEAQSKEELFFLLTQHLPDNKSIFNSGLIFDSSLHNSIYVDWPSIECFEEWMMFVDFRRYMTDDILAKVDRASMASSLETRVPFLDKEIISFAWNLPLEKKIRGKENKWILKQLLKRRLPSNLFERPKKGFSIPIDDWLRGPLKQWAEELLDFDKIRDDGIFDTDYISQLHQSHMQGLADNGNALWNILSFQSWKEKNDIKILKGINN